MKLWAEVLDYSVINELLVPDPMIINKIVVLGLAHYDNLFRILEKLPDTKLINNSFVTTSSQGDSINCIELYSVLEWN